MTHFVPALIAALAAVFIVYRRRRRGRLPLRRGTGERSPHFGVIGLVAGREVRQRVRGRPFRIATALMLVGVAAAVIIPAETGGGSNTAHVGLVGAQSPALRQTVVAVGRSTNTQMRVVIEPDRPAADQALRAGHLDVVIIDARRLVVAKATSRDDPVVRALAALLGLGRAVQAAGLRPEQAAAIARAAPLPITSLEPAPTSSAGRSTATIALIIMFVLLTQYLTWTLIGVMEEKSSRVVEVLLASVRPLQLLTGKVIGIAAVVFAQAAALAVFAIALGGAVGSDLLNGKAPLVLLSAFVWLVVGYAFYCWLYAAAGSTVERQDQVQSLALPLSLPLIAGYVVGIAAVGTGTAATWFRVLAYFPPTAPFAMTSLVGLGAATWWQFVLSVLISVVSTVAVARIAASVYRTAILRTGRRVPLREVFALTGRWR